MARAGGTQFVVRTQGSENFEKNALVYATLRFAPVEDAPARLAELLRLFARGLCAPLPLFPESSWEFAQRKDGAKSARTDPLQAARKVWHGGGDYRRGECEDRWFQLAFRGVEDPLDAEFERLALAVARPIFKSMEESP